jgi:hypothetical protein
VEVENIAAENIICLNNILPVDEAGATKGTSAELKKLNIFAPAAKAKNKIQASWIMALRSSCSTMPSCANN